MGKLIRPMGLEEAFGQIYQIYQEAFPQQEQRTREGQKRAMENPLYHLLAKEEDGKVQAFLGYWDLPSCCFLEHLATASEARGKGLGKALVEAWTKALEKPAFLEIEPVAKADPMTARRKAFYERLGFCCNDFPYEQMPLKEGDKPARMLVMSYGRPVSEPEFLPFKREIYREVYGA